MLDLDLAIFIQKLIYAIVLFCKNTGCIDQHEHVELCKFKYSLTESKIVTDTNKRADHNCLNVFCKNP